jgi:RHS repeat-associated protein
LSLSGLLVLTGVQYETLAAQPDRSATTGPVRTEPVYPLPGLDDVRPNWTDGRESANARQQARESPRPLAQPPAPAGPSAYDAPTTPQRMIPGDEYTVPVTLTNVTDQPLSAKTHALSYHWALADGTPQPELLGELKTELPDDLAPGESVRLDAKVRAPKLADLGNKREQFVLNWDVRHRWTGQWWSETDDVPPLSVPVTVEDPTSDQLGVEQFFQFQGVNAGAGATVLTNQSAGNAVFSYNPINNPGRGLASFLRLTYNSQDTSNSFAGHGWSVSASSLTRLGSPLQFHGLLPGLVGHASKITMIDGDGTSHTFELNKHDSLDPKDWTYDEPAGVNIRLRRTGDSDPARAWVMTRPDRSKAYFDEQGYQTSMVDANGNQLTFHYEHTRIGHRNTGMLKHITDATGRQVLTFDYYEWGENAPLLIGTVKRLVGELTNLNVVNQLKSVTDVSGRKIGFVYDDFGKLRQLVDGDGTEQAKTFAFDYDGGLLNNAKLTSVTDPLGNATRIGYFEGGLLDLLHKKRVQAITDRRGGRTTFDYQDPDGHHGSFVDSVVTNPNGQRSNARIDGYGRPVRLTNAKQETTELTWDADNNVVRLLEPNRALSTWVYDAKTGYPLEIRDAEANAKNAPPTRLEYRFSEDGYVADLAAKTSPEGRRWTFGYDERGNLLTVTDPKGTATGVPGDYTTRYGYDQFGQLQTNTDANGNLTRYADFDPNGYPQRIIDPYGNASTFRYDVVGNVVSGTDAHGKTSSYAYDLFRRPLSTKQPWDPANPDPAKHFVITPGPEYDANDNVVRTTAANGAVTSTAYDAGDLSVSVTAPKDTPDGPAKVSAMEYDAVGNLIREVEPNGTATGAAGDFTTSYRYDQIDQLIEVTDAHGGRTTAEYDNTGNLVEVADARKTASPDPNDFTSRTDFDLVHRPIAEIDAAGNAARTTYDRDGNVIAVTDRAGTRSDLVLDERAAVVEQRVPHRQDGDRTVVNTTRFEYDQVGNRTRTITPRGVNTPEPDDFVQQTGYDKMSRVSEEINAYDPADSRYNRPSSTTYAYDAVGRISEVSAPPSEGQTNRNNTRYTYYDNGWIQSTEDQWNIRTRYEYNQTGQQTKRTFSDESGRANRTMTWSYYPDGKLHERRDDGVPAGLRTVLVDNSDRNYTETRGDWGTAGPGPGHQGFDYRTHQGGPAEFTWKADIPASGQYEVAVKFPKGQATNATYTVEHDGGRTDKTVDQTQVTEDGWVSLGKFSFTEGQLRKVTLNGQADAAVNADAVRWVRDNVGTRDEEQKAFEHFYDQNGNLTRLTDSSSGARADTYDVAYDQLNRATKVDERKGGNVVNSTSFGYDQNSNLLNYKHNQQAADYEYDARDLVSKVTNSQAGNDPKPKTTTFGYDAREMLVSESKSNNNKTSYEHFLDGRLSHQTERKDDGALVNEHRLSYDANGNRTRDESRKMNADNHAETIDRNTSYAYDPRDRVREVTKTKPDGGEDSKETYVNDDNNNVIEQTVGGRTSKFSYDRNRLVSASSNGSTSQYRYDTFGRLDKLTFAGEPLETYNYDGFDRTAQHKQFGPGGQGGVTTDYRYDPLDRTASQATTGTGEDKTTEFTYLGLGQQVIGESVNGDLRKSYQYSSSGERLSQIKFKEDGTQEDSEYSQNPHSDVEVTTGADGNTQSTYGYTAYGEDQQSEFSGQDSPEGQQPGQEPHNVYRYNSMRWDASSGNYDMGFRDYDPGINRFTSMDLYNGALADLNLTTDPFTQNRYAFGSGNPVSRIELDGHNWLSDLGHAVLDVAGLVPGVGEVADGINALWYLGEGNYADAGLSALGMIPFVGWGAGATKLGKWGKKIFGAADEVPPPKPPKADPPNTTKPPGGDPNKPPSGDTSRPPGGDTPAPTPRPEPAKPPAPKPPASKPPAASKPGGACPNSFAPGTKVLMADGSHKPIEQVKEGDQVVSTDPVTGRSEPRPVVATIAGQGMKNLVEVTVDTDGDRGNATGTVLATDGHPFWVDNEGHWQEAKNLKPGQELRTPGGENLLVVNIRTWTSFDRSVHNLSIGGTPTYNIEVGDQNVLVHNAGPPGPDVTCGVGPFAGESIPARGKGRDWTADEIAANNRSGDAFGCHTCGTLDPGTKRGNWILDHQPPSSWVPNGFPQRLYPQCASCSSSQGNWVRRLAPIMKPIYSAIFRRGR